VGDGMPVKGRGNGCLLEREGKKGHLRVELFIAVNKSTWSGV
jgi:hypothetical protein